MLEMTVEYVKQREQFGRADRQLPGGQAPPGGHDGAGRGGPLGLLVRGVRGGRGRMRSWPRPRPSPRATAAMRSTTVRRVPYSCTAASASPGSTMRTCTSSARGPAPRSSAARPGSASSWLRVLGHRARPPCRCSEGVRDETGIHRRPRSASVTRPPAGWRAQLSGPFQDVRGVTQPERHARAAHASGSARSALRAGAASAGRCEFGGRDATLAEQVIFAEEYARARAPAPHRAHGHRAGRPHHPRLRHARRRSSASCCPSRAARSSGARATASPTPARIWPTCARAPPWWTARRPRVGC